MSATSSSEKEDEKQQRQIAIISMPIVILIGLGLALAGSANGIRVGSVPIFVLCVAMAFVIQWICAIPFYIMQTEKYFDLVGSLTHISFAIMALVLSGKSDLRSYLLVGLVVIWAGRLGTFLFLRILRDGSDDRWDDLKKSFARFLLAWTLQGLWVSFTLAAAIAAVTAQNTVEIGILAIIGAIIWLFGFGFEVIADWQKRQFRSKPQNDGKFINTGLWAYSRHPNYFGEIVLWVGVALIALPVLQGWQYITLISPIFVYILLTRISGVPMLEAKANKKWGGQPDYEAYKAKTPELLPKLW